MKLTQKDKDFLERLKLLLESKDLSVDMKEDGYKRLVLKQNYGDKIESAFRMSRQGVRWRFVADHPLDDRRIPARWLSLISARWLSLNG